MYSFIIESKGVADLSVTGTYMNIVKTACESVGDVESVKKGEHASNKKNFIVTDTIQAALSYFLKGYKNHIVWMQGTVPEESYMRNHSRLRLKVWSMMEKFVLKRAKLLLLVSDAMLHHYEAKYKLKLAHKSVIMPCFNETELVEGAFEEKKYQENNFVYVGSLHAWQCFEQTVALYSKVEKASPTPTAFHVFTFQKEQATEILKKHNIQNYYVDCVGKDELSERIKGMKYGFVLREDCTVNNVATPTKFSNYLANGIIPIYSSALKSFAQYDQQSLGIVCELNDTETGVANILEHTAKPLCADEIRKQCQKAFDTYYNKDAYIQRIAAKLKK